jgi:acyl-CoA synthetase (NDP forming)
MLQKAGLFEYDYPRKALLAYSRLLKQKDWEQSKDEKITSISLPKPGVLKSLQSRLSKEKKLCNNMLTSEVIEAFGIPTLKEKIASSQKDISQIWEEF